MFHSITIKAVVNYLYVSSSSRVNRLAKRLRVKFPEPFLRRGQRVDNCVNASVDGYIEFLTCPGCNLGLDRIQHLQRPCVQEKLWQRLDDLRPMPPKGKTNRRVWVNSGVELSPNKRRELAFQHRQTRHRKMPPWIQGYDTQCVVHSSGCSKTSWCFVVEFTVM